jgi:proteasome component ECM29
MSASLLQLLLQYFFFLQMLTYMRLCLARSAGVPLKKCEVVQHPSHFTPLISRYLRQLHQRQAGSETLDQYLNFIQQLLTACPSVVPVACLLELVGSVPDLLAMKFIDKLNWLKVNTLL